MSKNMAENDPQNWCMTMFQTRILSQRKINDWYSFATIPFDRKWMVCACRWSSIVFSDSDIQGSWYAVISSCFNLDDQNAVNSSSFFNWSRKRTQEQTVKFSTILIINSIVLKHLNKQFTNWFPAMSKFHTTQNINQFKSESPNFII